MRSSQCRTTLGVTILLIAVFAANPPARAQVIARPNQITGTFQLTNTNPDILALLQTRGLHSLWVEAKSQGLTPQLTCSAAGVIDDPLHGHYEIVVESADPGIVYDVTAAPGLRGGGAGGEVGSRIPCCPSRPPTWC